MKSPLLKPLSALCRTALALVLACGMMLPLSGCKDTDVLTQQIISQNAEETDYSLTPVRQETPTGIVDSLSDENQGESDSADEQTEDDPTYDESSESDGQTQQSPHSEDTPNQDNASEGTDAAQDQTGNKPGEKGEGEGDVLTVLDPSKNDDNGQETPDDSDEGAQGPGNSQQESNRPAGGSGGTGQIYADGTYTELPEARSVAATGQVATFVAAIGGGESLGCTSADWLATARSKGAFPGELDGVQVGWTGDGSTPSTMDVDAIVSSGVDALLCQPGEVTQEQAEALAQAGINVVQMPVLGEVDVLDADIETSAQVVGVVLSSATGGASATMAQRYISMRTEALSTLRTDNGGLTTWLRRGKEKASVYQGTDTLSTTLASSSSNRKVVAYVDDWVESNEGTIIESRNWYSEVMIWPSVDGSPYLVESGKAADAYVDTTGGYGVGASRSGRLTLSSYALFDYYLQYAGAMDIAVSDATLNNSLVGEILGSTYLYDFFNSISSHTWLPFRLGDDVYPALITRNVEYAERIKASAAIGNGYYNVGQAYEVWVLPSGLDGSWADGSMESYLAALWAAGKLDGSVDEYARYVDDFYSTFFRTGRSSVVENWNRTYDILENRS